VSECQHVPETTARTATRTQNLANMMILGKAKSVIISRVLSDVARIQLQLMFGFVVASDFPFSFLKKPRLATRSVHVNFTYSSLWIKKKTFELKLLTVRRNDLPMASSGSLLMEELCKKYMSLCRSYSNL